MVFYHRFALIAIGFCTFCREIFSKCRKKTAKQQGNTHGRRFLCKKCAGKEGWMVDKKCEKKPCPEKCGQDKKEARHSGDIPSDVLGSYTGKPRDGGKPVQDADDL